jgi:Putative MetA-pathway of phenol degradation
MRIFTILLFFVIVGFHYSSDAQELEPRSLTNLPIGTNFIAAGYGFSWGSTLLDASIPIEDLNSNIHGMVAAYARSINFFGMGGKFDIIVPYAIGDWDGFLEGTYAAASRSGFGDPRFRFSFNFFGSPALKLDQFKSYQPHSIAGFSIQVYAPLGQYSEDKLINLGSNRWTIKPQIGIARYRGKWIFEGYISAWIFTANNEFFGGNKLKVRPLYTFKFHLIRSLPKRTWIAFDIGYGLGAKTELNEMVRDDRISSMRFGTTFAIPFAKKHAVKLSYYSAIRFEKGADFDALAISYQFRWF